MAGQSPVAVTRVERPERCGGCPGCLRTGPCGACYYCTRGRMGACSSRACAVQQRQGLMSILQNKMERLPQENGTGLTSVMGPQPTPERAAGRGRQPLTERCKMCEGCLRTEKCGMCAGCTKQTSCAKMKCRVQIAANNKRMQQRKLGEGWSTSPSPSVPPPAGPLGPASPLGPSLSPVRGAAPPKCGVCQPCLLMEPCKDCSMCLKGSSDCLRRRCKEKMRFYNKQQSLKKQMALRQLAELESGSSPGSSAPASPGSPMMPFSMMPFANHNLFSPSKIKAPKTKRCEVCEGCLNQQGCGTCGFCTSGNPLILNRCPAKLCKNRIPIQPHEGASAKRKGRCGECPGCKVDDCGNCDNCVKKKLGETLRSNQFCYNKKCDELEKEKEKKPKTKKTRCGVCESCKMTEGCGKCATCLKNYPHLCPGRRCRNPIITEVQERERSEAQPGHGTTARGRRCQECEGCLADPCGTCNACQKTPDLCKARECMNRKVRGKIQYGTAPLVQNNTLKVVSKGRNPRRYKRCGKCEGCQVESCGHCQSCRHNKEYADQMLAPASCENIVCDDPIDLFGTNHKVLSEDGTCPTRVIMGKLYDFRCYFCKTLPRVGMANRSELYRHYSVMHYTAELKAEFGNMRKCGRCNKDLKKQNTVSHMGQTHDEVHKYLPERAKIPRKVQKGDGSRGNRRGAVFVRRRFVNFDFPDLPDGFDPKGETREVTEVTKEPEVLEVDGFVIELELVPDEPLVVSREEPYKPPQYSGGANCIICKSEFSEVVEAVGHIHRVHNIKGGSPHVMLDIDRLLKAGYLALRHGETETRLTERGRRVRRKKTHPAFRAAPPAGLVRLVGTGLPNDTRPPIYRQSSLEEGADKEAKEERPEEGAKEEKESLSVGL